MKASLAGWKAHGRLRITHKQHFSLNIMTEAQNYYYRNFEVSMFE